MRDGGHDQARASLSQRREREVPPVLDADQLARLLHLGSRREVLKLVRARVLPHVRLGPKRILFLLDSVLAALKRREVADLADGDLGGQE